MTVLTEGARKIAARAAGQARAYAAGQDRPLGGYAVTMVTYATVAGALAGLARLTGRPVPERLAGADIAIFGTATYKLSRLLAKDPVTSPLRAPFATYTGTSGPAELSEDVRGSGGRKAIGELVTCPFCMGVWISTVLTAGTIYLPRTTRLAAGTCAALALSDLLQFGHSLLEQAAEGQAPG
jgi:hypothetical protein